MGFNVTSAYLCHLIINSSWKAKRKIAFKLWLHNKEGDSGIKYHYLGCHFVEDNVSLTTQEQRSLFRCLSGLNITVTIIDQRYSCIQPYDEACI
jgi:hypothetical protein